MKRVLKKPRYFGNFFGDSLALAETRAYDFFDTFFGDSHWARLAYDFFCTFFGDSRWPRLALTIFFCTFSKKGY